MGVMLSSISRAPVGVPGKADEIIRQASLCTIVSFLTRYFLLTPLAQDTHAYDMIGRIIAVYIHFIIDDFTDPAPRGGIPGPCPPKRGLCPEEINRLGASGVQIEVQISVFCGLTPDFVTFSG